MRRTADLARGRGAGLAESLDAANVPRLCAGNNIQLQQSRNDYLSGLEDTREAKAALLPSLAVSATQGYTNYPSSNAEDNNSYTGTYGINAGLTLYEGGKLRTAVKEQRLQTASTHSRSPNPRTTSASPSSKPTCRRSTPPKPWR